MLSSSSPRVIVGAHYGLRDWLAQRVTAVLMVAYVFALMWILLSSGRPQNYFDWYMLFFDGVFFRIATLTFFVCLIYHAWVGMRDIWMDYIKPSGLRLWLQSLTVLYLLACGLWVVRIFAR